MDTRSQHDQHMEDLVRAAPDIEASRMELFRKARAVDERADEDQSALDIVVGQAGLLVELRVREEARCVNNGGECGKAGQDEDGEAEEAVLTALVGGVDDDVDGQGAEGADLVGRFG